jgi:hypothetical protein
MSGSQDPRVTPRPRAVCRSATQGETEQVVERLRAELGDWH